MKLEVLVSTMNQKNINNLLDKMNIKTDSVIINQTNFDSENSIVRGNNLAKCINLCERGLSKSRNLADICLLADDDIVYTDDMKDVIVNEFQKNEDIDIIAFQLYGLDKVFKKYPKSAKKIGYINSMKLASVEIAFRRQSIIEKKIYFNTLLGAGSKYFMGEESEFLFRCLDKGLKIKYIPIKIGDLIVGDSTWFKGYNKEYFISKGAAFTGMSIKKSRFLILQFAMRKRKIYKHNTNIIEVIKWMNIGRKEYLKCRGKKYV